MAQNESNPEEQEQMKQQMLVDVGADILKWEADQKAYKARKTYEEDQVALKYGDRLDKDIALRQTHELSLGTGADTQLGPAFMDPITKRCKELYKDYADAVKANKPEDRDKAFGAVKMMKQEIDAIKEMKVEYADNMFGGEGSEPQLSRGCSRQQISISDQLYTLNPELRIEFGSKKHIKSQMVDFYNRSIKENEAYGVVQDYAGNEVYVNFKEGNKDLFVPPFDKALEWQNIRKEQSDIAMEAQAGDETPDLNIGDISYQMNKLFAEKNTVLAFALDDMLSDGSTFKEHLYNHEALEYIDYKHFDLAQHDENRDGVIDEIDRASLIDALTNQDNDYFNIDLLRELVIEYYTKKVWNAWAKQFGFTEDWLHNIQLNKAKINLGRFKMDLEKARAAGDPIFMFDGKQYLTKESVDQVAIWEQNKDVTDYMKDIEQEDVVSIKEQEPQAINSNN